jgi:murein L,D-transpeptidase YafK
MIRWVISVVLLLAGGFAVADDSLLARVVDPQYSGSQQLPRDTELPIADRVVVLKSERRLQLLRRGQVLRSYRIALGLQPDGAKERAGDFRTPEGSYRLTRRNARSDFFLSIQVSYPNDSDRLNARRNGWDPGGSIMVHGLPNNMRRATDYYLTQDWTDGCIALSNSDMVEFWLLTQDNLPIEIRP